MASYLYYVHDESAIPDVTFDYLCKQLLERFDTFEHPHKYLVTKGDLDAGTGFRLTERVAPLRLKSAAMQWLQSIQSGEIKW